MYNKKKQQPNEYKELHSLNNIINIQYEKSETANKCFRLKSNKKKY